MISIKMELDQINYRACVEAILPQLVEHCSAKRNPNELDRFLTELGADAVPAVCSVLNEMSEAEKKRMTVWLAANHEERMRNAANRHLTELLGGPMIRVGRLIAAEQPDGSMLLEAAQVEVDYPSLLKSPFAAEGVERIGKDNGLLKGAARLAMQMGSHLPSDSLEKYCVALLNTEKIRKQLMLLFRDALAQAGLEARLRGLSVEDASVIQLPERLTRSAENRPDHFEKEWMELLLTRYRALRGVNNPEKG